MIINVARLFIGGFLGFRVALFNIQIANIGELLNNHLGIINGIIGMFVGILTVIFLYWQIKKIILDYKIKKRLEE